MSALDKIARDIFNDLSNEIDLKYKHRKRVNANIFCGIKFNEYLNSLKKQISIDAKKACLFAEDNIDEVYGKLYEKYFINELEFTIIRNAPIDVKSASNFGLTEYCSMPLLFKFNSNLAPITYIPSFFERAENELNFEIDYDSRIMTYLVKMKNNDLAPNLVEEPITFMEKNIRYLNNDISKWNSKLHKEIKGVLNTYSDEKDKFSSMYQKLNILTNANQYLTPQPIRKKIIPKINEFKTVQLHDEVYNDIILTLKNVGRAIESKRRIYLDAYEKKTTLLKNDAEDFFRDIFLLFLETRYEGVTATGETFNKAGKTDIILKNASDSCNIFIAECKIWKGPQYTCIDAIEQLLSYITVRETKTALLIFVKELEILDKITTFESTIEKQKYFLRRIKKDDDFTISYELKHPEDCNILVKLEVLFFHFPKIEV